LPGSGLEIAHTELEEQPACFVVRDHNEQQLAYVYYENEAAISGEVAHEG